MALAVWTARLAARKVVFPVPPRYARQDVDFLRGLIEAGEYRPVIDRCYPLEQVVDGDQVRRDAAEDGKRRPHGRCRPPLTAVHVAHRHFAAPVPGRRLASLLIFVIRTISAVTPSTIHHGMAIPCSQIRYPGWA